MHKKSKNYFLFIFTALLALFIFIPPQEKSYNTDFSTIASADSSEEEMRGIWVASIVNLDYPVSPTTSPEELRSQADEILENVEAWGFNTVFLQVRPCSDALYVSNIYPWSSYLTGEQGTPPGTGFDPLNYWIEESHRRGIELHAWINPFRITHSASEWDNLADNSPARLHPEWTVQFNDNFYFDPAIPQVRQMVIDGAIELVENYDLDGIHMDDHFYPDSNFDDASSYEIYGQSFSDPGDWRRNNINLLVQSMSVALHNSNPDIKFGIAPSGVWACETQNPAGSNTVNTLSSYYDLYADTKYWVEEGWLDYIAPQLYWEIGNERADFAVLLDWWADVVAASEHSTKLYIGLADSNTSEAISPDDPWYDGAEIERQLNACHASLPVSGTIHFRYHFIAEDENLQEIICHAYQD